MELYPLSKALHVVSFVLWFAGILFHARLLLQMQTAKGSGSFDQAASLAGYAYYRLMIPGMVLTLIFGIYLLVSNSLLLKEGWMHIKLTLILLLIIYHHASAFFMKKMIREETYKGPAWLNIWQIVPFVMLILIAFLAVLRIP